MDTMDWDIVETTNPKEGQEMPRLFRKRVAPENLVILSETDRTESCERLDDEDPEKTGGRGNAAFEDTSSRGSRHSSGFYSGVEYEDDMKVRPSLSHDVGINAVVGEKLARAGKSGYTLGRVVGRNGTDKVYNKKDCRSTLHLEKSGHVGTHSEVLSDETLRCGWGLWRPHCIQVFNNPKGYLFFFCLLGLIQNMTVLGYLNVVLTTLERRFRLTSVRSGFIVTAYDLSNLIVCAFVSYFGERGRKPIWVGVGSILFSVGSVIFALPHFLAPPYQYGVAEEAVCSAVANATSGEACQVMTSVDESLLRYYWLFIAGQVLHGWGGSTLYTLGITYMDESLPSSMFGLYMGIFTAMNAVGPALGYIIGGAMLSDLYTDILTPVSSLGISSNNPVWVGAWWLGFVINACLLFVTALVYLGFPKKLPVSHQVLQKKRVESQAGCEFKAREGIAHTVRDFPVALWKLLKNIPFMCISGMATTEWFVNAGLTSFGPKFFESQFNNSAGDASTDIGIISVLAGIIGAIVSGILMKRLDLSVKGLLKMSLVCALVSFASQFVYIFHCPDVPFAGVTIPYSDRNAVVNSTNLTAACHSNCTCSDSFDPVCGEDSVLYYSACHAGCVTQNDTIYSECKCVPNISNPLFHVTAVPAVGGSAVRGRCSHTCGHRWIFYIMMFVSFTSTSMLIVPAWTATIRCVAHSLRGFALGLQTVMYGALGTVPAPVIFGLLIDRSCLLWQTACDGSRSCWLYDNQKFSHSFLLITVLFKAITLLLCAGALLSYKPVSSENDVPLRTMSYNNKVSAGLSSKSTIAMPYPLET